MKRTTWMMIALAALLTAPAFAVTSPAAKKTEAKKEETKAAPTVEPTAAPTAAPTVAPTAEPTKEESKAAPAKEDGGSPKASHKSPALATTLAFIPGVALHGAGHMYAGSWMKGTGLLAIEGVAIWMGVRYSENIGSDMDKVFKTSNNQVPSDLGPVYSRMGILVVATSAFVFTWIEDIMGASTAVDVYNKKSDQAARASLQLAPSGDGLAMVYQRKF